MSLVTKLYEPHVLSARARLSTHPTLLELVDPSINPALLERFFLQWNSLGVYMTEPVEGWIRRAGERCKEVGVERIGEMLVTHARHEAGHHLMMIEDVQHLVKGWNARRQPRLDAEQLLAQPPTDAMRDYHRIHEETIRGDLPAGQVAIELEIENLSVVLLPPLLANVERVLGREFLLGLSFMKEHAELDVGHTALNQKMMEDLLALMPERGQRLGEIGSEALDIYLSFLGECLDSARRELRAVHVPRPQQGLRAS